MRECTALPTDSAEEVVQAALHEFVGSAALQQIVKHFGYEPHPMRDALDDLHAFARQHFHYRQGAERHATIWPTYDTELTRVVDEWGPQLPLMNAHGAEREEYDLGLVFGAGGEVAQARMAKMREQYHKGVKFGALALLGSNRHVTPEEAQRAGLENSTHITTEFELMNALFEDLWHHEIVSSDTFEICSQTPHGGAKGWRIQHYQLHAGVPVFSLCSEYQETDPDGRLRRRADTRDTLAFLRKIAADSLHPEVQILGVTSTPSTLYQYMMALDEITIPTGATVEMISHPLRLSPPAFMQEVVKAGLDHALRVRKTLSVAQTGW